MKINEVCSPLKHYLATVRVVVDTVSTTARTTINADSSTQAIMILTKVFGKGNVFSVSEIVNEAPQTHQIQRERAIRPTQVRRRAKPRKSAQIQSSQVQQQRKLPRKRTVSARPIASPIKHELVQQQLTKQILRQANMLKPTSDDIRIAKSRAETALKRADLDYEKQAQEQLRREERKSSLM